MFVSDRLLYVQLQKTGSTHLSALFASVLEGQQIGKHEAPEPALIASDRLKVSSIRNPWSWYLSLWAYGVSGRGGLRNRISARKLSLKRMLTAPNDELSWLATRSRVLADYRDDRDVEAFRRWLHFVLDEANADLLGERYGESGLPPHAGFMTHRYLKLCCRDYSPDVVRREIHGVEDIAAFDRDRCFIDVFVRQESLEQDFCDVLDRVRPLTGDDRTRIHAAKKTNTSRRRRSAFEFFDDASRALIRRRELLIVDKFDYAPPQEGDAG